MPSDGKDGMKSSSSPSGSPGGPSLPPSSSSLPAQFGRYTLTERLATGGMAEVFKAKISSSHGFEKLLVIKRILPHLAADKTFVAMFIDEAKLTAQLTHPKIVQVTDFGDVDGQYFIALEFIDGFDALALLRAAAGKHIRLPVPIGMFITMEVLDALDYAHNAVDAEGRPMKIVHRDISPSNVFIARRGDVKLGDFGIAHAQERESKTQAGTLKGKYGYMSPEQVVGSALDSRSDLFAVGIVLAEVLMGRRLFTAPNDLDVLLMVRDGKLDRLEKYGRDIPPALDEILRKSLARRASDRYQTAAEFRDALGELLFKWGFRVSASDVGRIGVEFLDPDPAALPRLLEQCKRWDLRAPITGVTESPAGVRSYSAVTDIGSLGVQVPSARASERSPLIAGLVGPARAEGRPVARAGLGDSDATPSPEVSDLGEDLGLLEEPLGASPSQEHGADTSNDDPIDVVIDDDLSGDAAPRPVARPPTPPVHALGHGTAAPPPYVLGSGTAAPPAYVLGSGATAPPSYVLGPGAAAPPAYVLGPGAAAPPASPPPRPAALSPAGPGPAASASPAAQHLDNQMHVASALSNLSSLSLVSLDDYAAAPTPAPASRQGFMDLGGPVAAPGAVVPQAPRVGAAGAAPAGLGAFIPASMGRPADSVASISDVTPARVFSELASQAATGLVRFELPPHVKDVYLVRGAPESVSSSLGSERFGEYLVAHGALSQADLERLLAALPSYGGKLGEAIVSLGLMRPLDVFRHLSQQVRERVIEIFAWVQGQVSFFRDVANPQQAFPLGLDPFEIIGAGVLSLPYEHLERRFLGALDARPRQGAQPRCAPEAFRLGPTPRDVWSMLDGSRTLREWMSRFVSPDELVTFLRTLYLLVDAGLVDLR